MFSIQCARCDEVIKQEPNKKPKIIERDNWQPGTFTWNKKTAELVCDRCYQKYIIGNNNYIE